MQRETKGEPNFCVAPSKEGVYALYHLVFLLVRSAPCAFFTSLGNWWRLAIYQKDAMQLLKDNDGLLPSEMNTDVNMQGCIAIYWTIWPGEIRSH